jgi:hypothetical protein
LLWTSHVSLRRPLLWTSHFSLCRPVFWASNVSFRRPLICVVKLFTGRICKALKCQNMDSWNADASCSRKRDPIDEDEAGVGNELESKISRYIYIYIWVVSILAYTQRCIAGIPVMKIEMDALKLELRDQVRMFRHKENTSA